MRAILSNELHDDANDNEISRKFCANKKKYKRKNEISDRDGGKRFGKGIRNAKMSTGRTKKR